MWMYYSNRLISTSVTDRRMWVGQFGDGGEYAVFIESGARSEDGATEAMAIARGTEQKCVDALDAIVKALGNYENVMHLQGGTDPHPRMGNVDLRPRRDGRTPETGKHGGVH